MRDSCSFALAPHLCAHMFGARLSSWADTSLVAELVALQWSYPFTFGQDGVAMPGEDKCREIMFVGQDAEGFFCTF